MDITHDTAIPSVTDAAEQARERRALLCARLHAAADFVAAHPDVQPYAVEGSGTTVTIRDYSMNSAADLARVSRALGGQWQKHDAGNLFKLVREVLDGVTVELIAWREEVCEAVVVGTEVVEVPDPKAPKVTLERDVVEWKCRPVLAATEPA